MGVKLGISRHAGRSPIIARLNRIGARIRGRRRRAFSEIALVLPRLDRGRTETGRRLTASAQTLILTPKRSSRAMTGAEVRAPGGGRLI